MRHDVIVVLLVIAVVLLGATAFGLVALRRVNLLALGLCAWAASALVATWT